MSTIYSLAARRAMKAHAQPSALKYHACLWGLILINLAICVLVVIGACDVVGWVAS